jgi:hypothetical protein
MKPPEVVKEEFTREWVQKAEIWDLRMWNSDCGMRN